MARNRPLTWLAGLLAVGMVPSACAVAGMVHGSSGSGTGASSTGGDQSSASTGTGHGGASSSSSGAGTGGGPADPHCTAGGPDLTDCPCSGAGTTRACYPAGINPKTRGVGTCKDGQQTCEGGSEVPKWGPCTGAVTPATETCTDGLDHNCDGLVGCKDPTCANNAACNGACTNGGVRPCYDGPPGTESTGTCKPGTQTCVNGKWTTTCAGEVLPTMEVCSDLLDHNCNGLPGCFDFFNCLTDPACMPPPCMPANGCTCPMGTGDSAVCPNGDYGDPVTGLCCPCTTSTCDQLGCCGESVCAGKAACAPLACAPLPAACNGMVNADCDWEDLATSDAQNPPEDCDMMCCKCRPTICP